MSSRLRKAIHDLKSIDPDLPPYPHSQAREAALVEGLHGLAAHFNRTIMRTYIDSRGELGFVIANKETYGSGLAEVLSLVPRRTGVSTTSVTPLPQNSWCYINHFHVERLLMLLGGRFGWEEDADER